MPSIESTYLNTAKAHNFCYTDAYIPSCRCVVQRGREGVQRRCAMYVSTIFTPDCLRINKLLQNGFCREPQVWGDTPPSGMVCLCSWHQELVRLSFGVVCACVICGCGCTLMHARPPTGFEWLDLTEPSGSATATKERKA